MVAEGIIAMVWAAAGVSFYENTQALLEAGAGVQRRVVYEICTTTMGKIGGVLAMLGVIACPITSGDTAYRSARLTLADWFKIDQKDWKKRLLLTVPLLGVGAIICQIDYSVVWRYFSWSNQTLAMIALWAAAMYPAQNKRNYWICGSCHLHDRRFHHLLLRGRRVPRPAVEAYGNCRERVLSHRRCRRCYRRGRLPGAVPEEERKVQDQHSGTVIYHLMASRFTAGGHFWIAVCCPHASADGLRRIRRINGVNHSIEK